MGEGGRATPSRCNEYLAERVLCRLHAGLARRVGGVPLPWTSQARVPSGPTLSTASY